MRLTRSIEMLFLSLIYSLFLNVMFFSRKHVNTPEITAFKSMIVVNFFGVITELGCFLTIINFGTENIWSVFFCRAYLIYLTVFNVLFFDYQYTISRGMDFYLKHMKRIRRRVFIIIAIICLMAIFFPLTIVKSPGGIYSEGLGCNVLYLISFITSALMYVYMFKGLKQKTCKFISCIPFLSLEVLSIIVIIIQFSNHQFTLFTVMETLILIIMYFTIENPDTKNIEELKVAKSEADKANNAKSDFLSSMSLEIRTPLNAILGFAEDIKTREKEASKTVSEDADFIVEAATKLLEIIGNILDVNSIESSHIEIREAAYNFKKEMKELIDANAIRIGSKNIKLNIDISRDIPDAIIGDAPHVKEIVANLITNAIKYTDEGEITFKAFCDVNEKDIDLHMLVSDTGHGIKKESQERLFTKFDRLDATINSNIEGTGLGLVITKSLVELMDGEIRLESEYQKGSTFFVDIKQRKATDKQIEEIREKDKPNPVKEMVAENVYSSKPKEKKETVNENAKSVLVVDDNALNIKVASRVLEAMGFKTVGVSSGESAINKTKLEKYDLILMDIMMPEMDGVECFKVLKNIPNFDTPVIAFTADAVVGAENKYLNEGFNGYLAKPFNRADAEKLFKEILNS